MTLAFKLGDAVPPTNQVFVFISTSSITTPISDILSNGATLSPTLIKTTSLFNNYTNIIEIANQNQSHLFVHSILYVSSEKRNFKAVNKKVKKLNNKLYDYCVNNNIYFIDLNILLSDNNQLKNNYTTDGVHLNSDGYLVWLSVLKDEILN